MLSRPLLNRLDITSLNSLDMSDHVVTARMIAFIHCVISIFLYVKPQFPNKFHLFPSFISLSHPPKTLHPQPP